MTYWFEKEKKCKKCDKSKSVFEYHHNKKSEDGFSDTCKECYHNNPTPKEALRRVMKGKPVKGWGYNAIKY